MFTVWKSSYSEHIILAYYFSCFQHGKNQVHKSSWENEYISLNIQAFTERNADPGVIAAAGVFRRILQINALIWVPCAFKFSKILDEEQILAALPLIR